MLPDKYRWILIRLMVFLIPIGAGGVYAWAIQEKLIMLFDVFLFILIFEWLTRASRGLAPKFQAARSYPPLILLLIWGTLSAVKAISVQSTLFAVIFLIKAILVHIYLINNVHTRKQIRIIAFWLLAALMVQSLWGIGQKVTGSSFGLVFLGEKQLRFSTDIARVRATLWHPNHFGTFIALTIWFSIIYYFFSNNKKKRTYHFALIGAAMLALMFSLSRSSWIGFIFATLISVWQIFKMGKMSPKLFKTLMAIGIIAILLVAIMYGTIEQRMAQGEDGTYRLIMINISLPLIASNPILGVGLFNNQYHSFNQFRFWKPVHNTYLRLAVETGIPGLFFFLWYLVVVFKASKKCLRIKDDFFRGYGLAVMAAYSAFIVIINFGPEYAFYRIKFLLFLLGAIPFILLKIRRNEYLFFIKKQQAARHKKSDNKFQNNFMRISENLNERAYENFNGK